VRTARRTNVEIRKQEVRLKAQFAKRAALWFVLLLLTSCINAGGSANHPTPAATPSGSPAGVVDVRDAVNWIAGLPANAGRQSLTLNAVINQAPTQVEGSDAPPANCPVVFARLPPLTDKPFATDFSVAGVTLPNLLPSSIPSLELVIPNSLGIIDLPAHGELHGHVLDPDYVSCPDARSLFILDSISNASGQPSPTPASGNSGTIDWQPWSDAGIGLALNYPAGWSAQVTRNVGSVISAVFTAPDGTRRVSLDVIAGETHWTEDANSVPPAPLAGNRRLVANAGVALGRLVDVVGAEADQGHQRTFRLVFNYGGNTVSLSMNFVDGMPLDTTGLAIFSGMAASVKFSQALGITDPMDPTLTAKTVIGPGPFIGQDTAISLATATSSLTQVTVDDYQLVSERAAREATPGICREFSQRPEAVWLITLSGTKPTGESARRLVYLDATDGASICQTDLPASP